MTKSETKNQQPIDPLVIEKLRAELNNLGRELVELNGKKLKASQCYHFDVNPMHVLFNTNCPESLKQKVQAILSKYLL